MAKKKVFKEDKDLFKKAKKIKKSNEKKENKIEKVMHEYKEGELPMGKSKKKVKKRSQAVAIALNEARKVGAKIPKKKKK